MCIKPLILIIICAKGKIFMVSQCSDLKSNNKKRKCLIEPLRKLAAEQSSSYKNNISKAIWIIEFLIFFLSRDSLITFTEILNEFVQFADVSLCFPHKSQRRNFHPPLTDKSLFGGQHRLHISKLIVVYQYQLVWEKLWWRKQTNEIDRSWRMFG